MPEGKQTPEITVGQVSSQYSLFNKQGQDTASVLTAVITPISLITTASFLSGIQLIGEPIECWCPAQTTDAMCNYTKSICWISKQYVIDYGEAIPQDPLERDEVMKRQLDFYPLVPFILLVLAIALKLPNFLWTAFQGEEGLNIEKAIQLATNVMQNDEQGGREVAFEMNFSLVRYGARHTGLSRCGMAVKRVASAVLLFPMGAELGTYQTGLYLTTRLLALAFTLAAYPALGHALQTDFTSWGWVLLHWLLWDGPEPDRRVFPRETLCDFRVRQLQNVQEYTVQCVLPINMWSEKVFVALWFWLGVLLAANLYSYQYWFRKLLLPDNRRALLSKHLAIMATELKPYRKKHVSDFAWNYLSYDSVLVLRMLEMVAGTRFANVVVANLWREYSSRRMPPPVEEVDDADAVLDGRGDVTEYY